MPPRFGSRKQDPGPAFEDGQGSTRGLRAATNRAQTAPQEEPGAQPLRSSGEARVAVPPSGRRKGQNPQVQTANLGHFGSLKPGAPVPTETKRREIPLCAGRPVRRSEPGRKTSACSVRNDGGRGVGRYVGPEGPTHNADEAECRRRYKARLIRPEESEGRGRWLSSCRGPFRRSSSLRRRFLP